MSEIQANGRATSPGTPGASIDWNYTAPTTINVFFAGAGIQVYDDGLFTTTGWSAAEIAAAKRAFQNFEDVTNVTFNYVNSIGQADFVMMESPDQGYVEGSFGYWGVGGGNLDYDGAFRNLDGWGVFNSSDSSWTTANLQQGGYGYITLIHEIAHGMGLAHPHDNGGGSEIMDGVDDAFDDYGDFNLNQGIYTTMSYNDGWHTAPHVPERNPAESTYGFGWQGTLMALDIAVLQEKYGVNTSYHRGNDTYILPSKNGAGTFYSAIWDAGGKDTIRHDGKSGAVINLTAAALDYSATGGGVVSYADGIYGGFTIANGAVIENATGGSGADKLTGNSAANILNGRAGADTMVGLRGNDTYYVDNIKDLVDERSGNGIDTVKSYIDFDLGGTRVRGDFEKLILVGSATRGTGNDLANVITGNASVNRLIGGLGADTLSGMAGGDIFDFNAIAESRVGVGKRDIITDFSQSQGDRIDLSGIDAKSGTAANDAFKLLATEGAAFTGAAGQLRFDQTLKGSARITLVEGDVNGDGVADFQIELSGWINLKGTGTTSDFIL